MKNLNDFTIMWFIIVMFNRLAFFLPWGLHCFLHNLFFSKDRTWNLYHLRHDTSESSRENTLAFHQQTRILFIYGMLVNISLSSEGVLTNIIRSRGLTSYLTNSGAVRVLINWNDSGCWPKPSSSWGLRCQMRWHPHAPFHCSNAQISKSQAQG